MRLVRDANQSRDEALCSRLSPLVHKLLWTFLGADAERDDLAHEIFIRLLKGARNVRDPARLEAWAARVTMNAIKNEFRRRKLRRFFSLGVGEDPETLLVHPDFEGRELLLRTYRTLERLPMSERLPFSLRLLDQASAEDIAVACDCSVRTVKRRLKAGRLRFLKLAQQDPLLSERLTNVLTDEGAADE